MTKDIAASVRARLLNIAKAQGADFNQVLVRFALERMLYRLSQSKHADRFLLKGALLFTLWYDGLVPPVAALSVVICLLNSAVALASLYIGRTLSRRR